MPVPQVFVIMQGVFQDPDQLVKSLAGGLPLLCSSVTRGKGVDKPVTFGIGIIDPERGFKRDIQG